MRLRGILFLGAAAIIFSLGVSAAKAHFESEEVHEETSFHTAAMPIMLVDGDVAENPVSPLITMIAGGSVVATLLAFRLMHKKK